MSGKAREKISIAKQKLLDKMHVFDIDEVEIEEISSSTDNVARY